MTVRHIGSFGLKGGGGKGRGKLGQFGGPWARAGSSQDSAECPVHKGVIRMVSAGQPPCSQVLPPKACSPVSKARYDPKSPRSHSCRRCRRPCLGAVLDAGASRRFGVERCRNPDARHQPDRFRFRPFGRASGADLGSCPAHGALRANPACALLLGEPGEKGDPLTHPRLMIRARARFIAPDDPNRPALRAHWLKGHPKATLYIDLPDFAFVRLEPLSALLNGGFGKAFRFSAEDLCP